jgi:hypothetical protein
MSELATVKHSGNIGDILYSLPVVKHIHDITNQKVNFYLNPIDDRMSMESSNLLKPLLEHQYYINEVNIYNDQYINYDLDTFRNYLFFSNLGTMHLAAFNFDFDLKNKPSIFLDNKLKFSIPTCDIIINRTQRYNNDNFPWEYVLNEQYKYYSKGFVGLLYEFNFFREKYNIENLIYIPIKNYLELAWLIKESKIFIGNCSSPYALAETLKHNTIQETCIEYPSCLYSRPNAQYFLQHFFTI